VIIGEVAHRITLGWSDFMAGCNTPDNVAKDKRSWNNNADGCAN